MPNRNLAGSGILLWRWFVHRRLRTSLPVARRRAATGLGAVALALAALAFSKSADLAMAVSARLFVAIPWLPIVVTPAIFAAVAFATNRWAGESRGSGIPQIIAASRDPNSGFAARLASMQIAVSKVLLTLLMLVGGASVGREGPTVQVSAAMMVWFHRLLKVPITAGVLIAGGAAGVAAAFNTPLAGVAFAIEELAAAYEQRVALLVMAAVMISGLVMIGIAGDYVYFGALRGSLDLRQTLLIAPAMGIVGGLSGGLFARIVLGFTRARLGWMDSRSRRLPMAPSEQACLPAIAATVSRAASPSTSTRPKAARSTRIPITTKKTGTRNVEIGRTRCSSCCSPRFTKERKCTSSRINPAA